MILSPLDILAFTWFIACWFGYAQFARRAARNRNSLSSVLYRYRKEWVRKLSQTGMSEVDGELLSSLEKQVSFMASTSLLILASLVTVLSAASEMFLNLDNLSFVTAVPVETIQLKLILMICIFIYAFFTFSWAIRQYGFCFILFGSSFHTVKYYKEADDYSAQAASRDYKSVAKVLDRAAHSYNFGIRAYYFAMAVLAWFINAWLFIIACGITVTVLYRREFLSRSLQALVSARLVDNVHDEDKILFD
ncbi:MAG: DUF599 domain-containing protein [Gammaproteobacteria bacterium]